MIHYALRCAAGHDFDGWFRGAAAFEQQAAAGLLACPSCASSKVSRALMAPRLSFGAPAPAAPAAAPPARPAATAAEAAPAGPPAIPDRVRALLQRIRAEVEQRCDYVGPDFAQAARAIHGGREATRPIYGETTQDEAEALAEDGIAVSSIPWLPRADS